VNVLTDLEKYDRHAAILANGQLFSRCDLIVTDELSQSLPTEFGLLACGCLPQCFKDIIGNPVIGLD
jgi:hypothetical protein